MPGKITENPLLIDILSILFGCIISAFAVSCILVPNHLSTSGITGLSLIFENFTGINYTYLYYAFSLTILILAYFTIGKTAAIKIIFLSILYPTILVFMNRIDFVFVEGDMFLVCIYFSLFYGFAGGLVLRRGFTFGGTDTLARILRKKVFKDISISQIMLVLDAIIIVVLGIVFGKDTALYALVNHVMCMFIVDYMLFGFRAKLYKVSIISQHYKEISNFIFDELKRGVTIHDVTGAYTNEPRKMTTCICSPEQSAIIRRFLAEHYPDVFMEVSPIVTVYGIGKRFVQIKDID